MIEIKQNLEAYTMEERLQIVLSGIDGAVTEVSYDKTCYSAYKEGKLAEMSFETEQEMRILELLEQLGFPMDDAGTYLYKNMIARAVRKISDVSTREEILACKDLVTQMKTPYSQFYVDVARNDLDMGVTSFHRCVQRALSKVDATKAEPMLLFQIYSNFTEDMDYGEQAFVLSSYVAGFLKPKMPEVPKIKMLPGIKASM